MNAIKKLMSGKNPELLVRMDLKMFGNEELAKLFLVIKRFYVDQGDWIGWDVLRSFVAQKSSSPDKARYILALLDQIQERDINGLTDELLLEDLTGMGKMRILLGGIQEIVQAAEARETDRALALFNSLGAQLIQTGNVSILNSDLLTLAGADVAFDWRTTGIQAIDRRNGTATGSLFLICGDTGTGKSTQAHSVSIHRHVKYSEGVAYWSWEQSKKEVMARIWSHQSDVDLGNIISDTLSTEERKKLRMTKLHFLFLTDDKDVAGYVDTHFELSEEDFIKQAATEFEKKPSSFFVYDHGPDFDQLLVEMELLRSVKGVKLFVVDYLTIVPAGAEHSRMQSWEMYIKMSQKLKNFARTHGVDVITPLQFDSKEGKIKFSKNIINDADLALFMFQDKEDVEMGTVTNEFAKYRNYKTIVGEPLGPFKQLRAFDKAKFMEIKF